MIQLYVSQLSQMSQLCVCNLSLSCLSDVSAMCISTVSELSLSCLSRRHQNPDEIIDRQSKWTEMSFVRKQRLDEVDVDHEDTFDLN